jgi:uncharacterized damage-inducible protein DinB
MTPEQAQFALGMLLGAFENETPVTRKVIAAMPENQTSLKPHEKSMSALDLAWHIVSSEVWFVQGIANSEFSQEESKRPAEMDSFAKILAWYDRELPAALAKLKALPPEKLAAELDFFGIVKMPAVAYLGLLNSHSVHHRGQFSVYLRLAGAKVPSIYGGSADEPFQAPA